MNRAEKIKRLREINKEIAEWWSYVDEAEEHDLSDATVEDYYNSITNLEYERDRLRDELERESY